MMIIIKEEKMKITKRKKCMKRKSYIVLYQTLIDIRYADFVYVNGKQKIEVMIFKETNVTIFVLLIHDSHKKEIKFKHFV